MAPQQCQVAIANGSEGYSATENETSNPRNHDQSATLFKIRPLEPIARTAANKKGRPHRLLHVRPRTKSGCDACTKPLLELTVSVSFVRDRQQRAGKSEQRTGRRAKKAKNLQSLHNDSDREQRERAKEQRERESERRPTNAQNRGMHAHTGTDLVQRKSGTPSHGRPPQPLGRADARDRGEPSVPMVRRGLKGALALVRSPSPCAEALFRSGARRQPSVAVFACSPAYARTRAPSRNEPFRPHPPGRSWDNKRRVPSYEISANSNSASSRKKPLSLTRTYLALPPIPEGSYSSVDSRLVNWVSQI